MAVLHLDYETKSEAQLTGAKSVGLWNYMKHPTTEPLMLAWSWDDGPVQQVDFTDGDNLPSDVVDGLLDPNVIKWAFNGAFERLATRFLLGIRTPIMGWRCSMALAYMRSFSGGLEDVGKQLGLADDLLKDVDGGRLVKMFCGPQRVTKKQPLRWRDRHTDPEDWERFKEYNRQDVVAENHLKAPLLRLPLPEIEWRLYEIDQEINDRGLPVDMLFVTNAQKMADIRKAELTAMMVEVTSLVNPNSVAQLLPWLKERGYPFDDLQKNTVKKVLATNGEISGHNQSDEEVLTRDAVAVLKLRQQASRSSVKKYGAIERRVCSRNRLRHCLQFAGAGRTNRWAGRGPQPHNFVRTPKKFEGYDKSFSVLEATTNAVRDGDYGLLNLILAEPMEGLAGCLRSSFRSDVDSEFVIADLSAIESAVIAWLSGCKRMLEVFRTGLDPYKDFAAELYKKPYSQVRDEERNNSKPAVLGCFGADTRVLTNHGWKRITEVTSRCKVYDGVAFVRTDGVVDQGVKAVIDLAGVKVTPDHKVLIKEGLWRSAWALSLDSRIEDQAIDLALGLSSRCFGTGVVNAITAASVETAQKSVSSTDITWKSGSLSPAFRVLMPGSGLRWAQCMNDLTRRETSWTFWPIGITPLLAGAVTSGTRITAAEGSNVAFGTFTHSLNTVWHCLSALLTLKLTGKTITDIMNQVISGSSLGRAIRTILGLTPVSVIRGESLRQRNSGESMRRHIKTLVPFYVKSEKGSLPSKSLPGRAALDVRVYDLANCGPRNRFMILTDRGPMIVHNCGFGLGGGLLKEGKRTGLWGYAESMGVDITKEEAKKQVDRFREVYSEIPAFWKAIDVAVRGAMEGRETSVGGLLSFRKMGEYMTVRLPSGRRIYYHRPKFMKQTFIGNDGNPYDKVVFTCMGKMTNGKKWTRINMSGPKLCENFTQAVARDVLALGMLRSWAYGFKLVGHVHDELITMRKIGTNDYGVPELIDCMVSPIKWAKGLPLKAAGFITQVYRK